MLRARIVLAAAGGQANAAIARWLGVGQDTVRKWRQRFAGGRVKGLDDLPRGGRPRVFADVAAAEVKAMACALPAETGVPLARWSATELAAEAVTRGVVDTVSASTVRRWLSGDAIKPWQCRSWIFPRDPDFPAKAARVIDLYDRTWNGWALGEDEYVISADEKSQLQALHRRHPDLPPAPGRVRRQEFEYRRGASGRHRLARQRHPGSSGGVPHPGEPAGVEAVVDPPAAPPPGDQTGLPQDPQVVGEQVAPAPAHRTRTADRQPAPARSPAAPGRLTPPARLRLQHRA